MSVSRRFFLLTAFELGLSLIALGLCAWSGMELRPTSLPTVSQIFLSLTGAFAMARLFRLFYRRPFGPFLGIRKFLDDTARPLFDGMGPIHFLGLSLAAGWGEESLFRGFLQPWLQSKWGEGVGIAAASAAFGAAHAVTFGYAFCSGLIGLGLGELALHARSWLPSAIAHGAYDFLALQMWLHRKSLKNY